MLAKLRITMWMKPPNMSDRTYSAVDLRAAGGGRRLPRLKPCQAVLPSCEPAQCQLSFSIKFFLLIKWFTPLAFFFERITTFHRVIETCLDGR